MNSGSPSKTSDPPLASSWARPPEFYCDENSVTRSVCRRLKQLGYTVHTPPELFGSREDAQGTQDETWLPMVGQQGWTIIGRDLKIFERPEELAAYRQSKAHVFLLPNHAKATELLSLIEINLAGMCAFALGEPANVWELTKTGIESYEIPKPRRRRVRKAAQRKPS